MAEKKVFKAKINPELIAQYARVFLANQRQGNVSAKTRGEVSGGGRKPWRQKGTGRARHGSTRSPIWVGGGVAHGPKPRDWSLKMPRKMRRQALLSALAWAEKEKRVFLVSSPSLEKVSTKKIADFVKARQWERSILFIFPKGKADKYRKLYLSSRNLPQVSLKQVANINAYDIVRCKNIVFFDGSEKEYA